MNVCFYHVAIIALKEHFNLKLFSIFCFFQYAVCITEISFPYIYGDKKEFFQLLSCSDEEMTSAAMAETLFHHLNQMQCNMYGVTALLSSSHNDENGVYTTEQKRIASAIYPTASLLNHACYPDVIARYVVYSSSYFDV